MSRLFIGDVHIYVSDMALALRFWGDGLGLNIVEQEGDAFARLDFPDGGCSLRLWGRVTPWESGTRPAHGTRPIVSFDVTTSELDDVLVRLLEHGGEQVGEMEQYGSLRSVTVADPDGNAFELLEITDVDA